MPSFRLISPLQTFHGNQGELLAGGEVRFFEAGTSTPAFVYGDKALTVNNGTSVPLDASGRVNVDVWGEGSYYVSLHDADGVKQGEIDHVEIPGGAGLSLPEFEPDAFLTNNGDVALWRVLRLLPDPSGQSGKVLSTDGENPVWIPKPADGVTPEVNIPAGGVAQTSTSFTIGKLMVQFGTGTAPASGGRTTSVGVTFGTAMASCLHVDVTPSVAAITGVGYAPVVAVTNKSGTGCTVNIDVNADQSGANISVGVPFSYVAFGLLP